MARSNDLMLAHGRAAGVSAAQRAFCMQQGAHLRRTLYRVLGSNRHMEHLIQDTFLEVVLEARPAV